MSLRKLPITSYFAGSPQVPAQTQVRVCYPPAKSVDDPSSPPSSGGGIVIHPISPTTPVPGEPGCYYIPVRNPDGSIGKAKVCRLSPGGGYA